MLARPQENRQHTRSFNGGKLEIDYTAAVKKGVLDGPGHIKLVNGETYDGDIRNGTLSGRAVYTWPSGDRYEGDYREGHRTRKGKLSFGEKITLARRRLRARCLRRAFPRHWHL